MTFCGKIFRDDFEQKIVCWLSTGCLKSRNFVMKSLKNFWPNLSFLRRKIEWFKRFQKGESSSRGRWHKIGKRAVFSRFKWFWRHDAQHNDTLPEWLISDIHHNDTQHNNTLPLCWMFLCWVSRFIYLYAECHYAECHYSECRYAECHFTVLEWLQKCVLL